MRMDRDGGFGDPIFAVVLLVSSVAEVICQPYQWSNMGKLGC